jgi:membrane protein
MSAEPYTDVPGGVRPARRPRRPQWPRLPTAWWPALRRTPASLWNDDITDYAAALTYYAILAVLPAMLATVLAFGMISPDTAEEFVTHVTAYAPAQSGAELHAVLTRALGTDGTVWPLLVAGAASALWSASSYLAVFRRALHHMHRAEDRRSPWRKAPRIVLTALALLGLLLVGSLTLLLTGPLAAAVGRTLGVDTTAAWAWSLLRWPVLLCLVALLVVVVFHTGRVMPEAMTPKHPVVAPGDDRHPGPCRPRLPRPAYALRRLRGRGDMVAFAVQGYDVTPRRLLDGFPRRPPRGEGDHARSPAGDRRRVGRPDRPWSGRAARSVRGR